MMADVQQRRQKAVVVVPEIPVPPRCGNAWRDVQQLHLLSHLGFAISVITAGRRWDLTDAEELAAAREIPGCVTYLSATRGEPPARLLVRASRKLGYLYGHPRHPFGWRLPNGHGAQLVGCLPPGGAGDVLLLRSIVADEIPRLRATWTGPIVVDCHDADVHLARELLSTVRGLHRLGPWANLVGVRRTLARYLPLADEVWAVSDDDADRIRRDAPGTRVLVVPSGLDERNAAPVAEPGTDGVALLVANFGYGPNALGAEWLLESVWPKVRARLPGAVLHLVGARMPMPLEERAQKAAGVRVHGPVRDVLPLLRNAGVVLAPLLQGAGTRVKIVEAWSQGKAVVTTPKGIEGLPLENGVVAVESDPRSFADAMVRLLCDSQQRASIGGAALSLFRRTLSWESARAVVAKRSIVARCTHTSVMEGR